MLFVVQVSKAFLELEKNEKKKKINQMSENYQKLQIKFHKVYAGS